MKGRALILIFLFLFFVINVASADTGTINITGDKQVTQYGDITSGSVGAYWYTGVIFKNPENTLPNSIRWVTCSVPAASFDGPDGTIHSSQWNSVNLKVGAVTVGTGQFGYIYSNGVYHIGLFPDDDNFDISGYSGQTHVIIEGGMEYRLHPASDAGKTTKVNWNLQEDNTAIVGMSSGGYGLGIVDGSEHVVTIQYSQQFDYNYTNQGSYYRLNFTHPSGHDAALTIMSGVREIIAEGTVKSSHDDIIDTDISNTTWEMTVENNLGDVIERSLDFGSVSTGEIEFNQTNYIDPENIEVEWDITGFNSNSFNYEIQVVTSISGDPSQDSWAADGNWNTSPFISSASGAAVFDFYSDGYDLPIWIQAELWAQDKTTGTWTKLDNTPAVIYHEKSDFGVGSIWTEKSTYNLSEMFYIFVETDYPIVEVELISDTYHDIQSLEVFEGGWQRVGYAFFSPHNFTAYLYEGGVITNQTSFSVWTTSPMLNIFLDSEALKTQFAFEFYTDNSSDTITGYKPDGSIFYGPITDLETGDRNIIRGVSSSSPPGIYTISLFHDGTTYYNDTIELYSTSEWVYFDASKYETGDRIKIYSFVTDSRQLVRLSDSIGTAVITWTDSAGYIIPNSQTVLYFSLTDNNEYGMNVNASIDSGTFQTGNWKVEIIGIDGKPLTNESTYDYTTVSKKIESPEDTSNEMISIFFSPEGAFLLFTVCLTMMGLGIAKHPAGGGAGAVVGVGFGVYFKVLPAWMLLLMVIALVVLAGVSIAVHFKGK